MKLEKVAVVKMDWITPQDVADRLYFSRKRHWPHGPPKVSLVGEKGRFGLLIFDFDDGDPLRYGIYIQDREAILGCAEMAVLNFEKLTESTGV